MIIKLFPIILSFFILTSNNINATEIERHQDEVASRKSIFIFTDPVWYPDYSPKRLITPTNDDIVNTVKYTGGNAISARDAVPDEQTAIGIAEAVWISIYSTEAIEKEYPIRAVLRDDIWYVSGSLLAGWRGGTAVAEIAKKDGRILRVSHGR